MNGKNGIGVVWGKCGYRYATDEGAVQGELERCINFLKTDSSIKQGLSYISVDVAIME